VIFIKKCKIIVLVLAIIAIIITFLGHIVNLAINIQWFDEVGYLSVYFTKLTTIIKITMPIFILSYIAIWAYYKYFICKILKWKKVIEKTKGREKLQQKLKIILNVVISLIIAISFATRYWYRILQFQNSTSFNTLDPLFKMDISFFIFKLPLIESLYRAVVTIFVLIVIVSTIIFFILTTKDHILSNNKLSKFKNINRGINKFAGKQLAIITSLILLIVAGGYLIKAWELVYSPKGIVVGASYTDIHVTLRFYLIIVGVSLISSISTFISILNHKTKPILISIILILVLIFGENMTTRVVQRFEVQANEKTLERPSIKYNIDSTRKAFNINNIQDIPFEIKYDLTKEDLSENKDIIDNIKINSFKPALEFYNQFQYMRFYNKFNDLDIDRYDINGKYNQVFIAPREINLGSLQGNSNTWQNRHLVYTHGYGVVMSKANSVTSEGQPDFIINNIPVENKTSLKLSEPRIYFGESTNDYSIVDTKIGELDYPNGAENKTNNYDGKAGIKMNLANKILFAVNQKSIKFLISNDITSNSKILIDRNIIERAKKIAPFLTYDNDPYIVISGGRLYWIIDAYTTSTKYPFSQTQDGVNYIRNSVKVVIDAVDGKPNFYIVDKTDPIVNNYSRIFPSLFKDLESVPSGIRQHFRYPEGLFNIQSNVLSKYHVTDAGVFYNGDDVWSLATNQVKIEGNKVVNEASYVIMKLPKQTKEEMVLLEYFNIKGRNNMVASFGARMDGENYGKLVLYDFPAKQNVYSPLIFKQKINQDTIISKELSLWNTQGSEVQFGETFIIPIKNSLLYVEPMYLRAIGDKSIPEMKKLIVSYSDKIVLADNIESALQQIFNYTDKDNTLKPQDNLKLDILKNKNIKLAKDLYNKAMAAQISGKWDEYGTYIKQLGAALEKIGE
jgi:uncharacterized protein